MNEATRLNLRKMVKEYGAEETTSKIANVCVFFCRNL